MNKHRDRADQSRGSGNPPRIPPIDRFYMPAMPPLKLIAAFERWLERCVARWRERRRARRSKRRLIAEAEHLLDDLGHRRCGLRRDAGLDCCRRRPLPGGSGRCGERGPD